MIMTIDELSEYLKVSKETVYKMIQREEIPCSFKIGGQWRFQKSKVDQWLEQLSTKESPQNIKNINDGEENGIC